MCVCVCDSKYENLSRGKTNTKFKGKVDTKIIKYSIFIKYFPFYYHALFYVLYSNGTYSFDFL